MILTRRVPTILFLLAPAAPVLLSPALRLSVLKETSRHKRQNLVSKQSTSKIALNEQFQYEHQYKDKQGLLFLNKPKENLKPKTHWNADPSLHIVKGQKNKSGNLMTEHDNHDLGQRVKHVKLNDVYDKKTNTPGHLRVSSNNYENDEVGIARMSGSLSNNFSES